MSGESFAPVSMSVAASVEGGMSSVAPAISAELGSSVALSSPVEVTGGQISSLGELAHIASSDAASLVDVRGQLAELRGNTTKTLNFAQEVEGIDAQNTIVLDTTDVFQPSDEAIVSVFGQEVPDNEETPESFAEKSMSSGETSTEDRMLEQADTEGEAPLDEENLDTEENQSDEITEEENVEEETQNEEEENQDEEEKEPEEEEEQEEVEMPQSGPAVDRVTNDARVAVLVGAARRSFEKNITFASGAEMAEEFEAAAESLQSEIAERAGVVDQTTKNIGDDIAKQKFTTASQSESAIVKAVNAHTAVTTGFINQVGQKEVEEVMGVFPKLSLRRPVLKAQTLT